MALLDDVKKTLRVSNVAHDTEITDLIESAKADLKISGIDVSLIVDTDPLIKRAIQLYCKAHFGYDNPDAEKFMNSYWSLKTHLMLSGDYVVV
jgi:uncharacterized phage protein (predicted DNA packaging)